MQIDSSRQERISRDHNPRGHGKERSQGPVEESQPIATPEINPSPGPSTSDPRDLSSSPVELSGPGEEHLDVREPDLSSPRYGDREIYVSDCHGPDEVDTPADEDRLEKIADLKNEIADLKEDLARSLDAAQNPKKINAHNQQLAADWRADARELRTEADDLLKNGFSDQSQDSHSQDSRWYN